MSNNLLNVDWPSCSRWYLADEHVALYHHCQAQAASYSLVMQELQRRHPDKAVRTRGQGLG